MHEDGLAHNTAVFIWTDHGPMPRGKRWPYDSGIRSPLIVRWPDALQSGSVSERLVSTVDLAPTVLSICGLEIPHHMQGRAFLGPREVEPRDYVYVSRDRYDEMYDTVRAVRDKRFKYIRHYHPEQPCLPRHGGHCSGIPDAPLVPRQRYWTQSALSSGTNPKLAIPIPFWYS